VSLDCVICCAFYSILFRGAVFFRSRCISIRLTVIDKYVSNTGRSHRRINKQAAKCLTKYVFEQRSDDKKFIVKVRCFLRKLQMMSSIAEVLVVTGMVW